jgi:hypothetical protein
MTINHLPTELRYGTDQSLGLFSAAEGFVFLSGLLAGWVYTRKFRAGGPAALLAASVKRAKSIYAWHIAAFVTCLVCVQVISHVHQYSSAAVPRLFLENPLLALFLGVTLLHQPGLLDLLPMYCAFVLLLPLVIGGLESGRRWLVLSVSGAIWLATQWAPPVDGAPFYPINTGSFNLLSWQFLFVAGVAIGHARISGVAQVSRPNRWVVAAAAALAAYGLGIRHAGFPPLWPDAVWGVMLNKPALGLLRMGDFAVVAYLLAIFGERFPSALVARPLAFLGRHSLVVVATQSVAIMVLLQFPQLFETTLDRTLTALASIGLLFVTAAVKQRFMDRPAPSPVPVPLGARQPAGGGLIRPDGRRAA